ncbi:MAG: DsrE family protein [Nitrospinae bacterium]|nr:DsrE family protein [Nitrospinota bacterium]
MKKIAVLFTGLPLGTNHAGEKLRMSLGLMLNDGNEVHLLFMGNGRRALEKLDEAAAHMHPVNKHVAMLARLGARFHVEDGGGFGYLPEVAAKMKIIQAPEAGALINDADAFIH